MTDSSLFYSDISMNASDTKLDKCIIRLVAVAGKIWQLFWKPKISP